MPHSEIHGSKLILSSPWHIAEYHVLHRLLLPRHPPNALLALDLIQKKTGLKPDTMLRWFVQHLYPRSKTYFFPAPSSRLGTSAILADRDGSNPCRFEPGLVYLTWKLHACEHRQNQGLRLEGSATDYPLRGIISMKLMCISLNDVKVRPIGRRSTQKCSAIKSCEGLVEPRRFELLTSCLQSRRSTN